VNGELVAKFENLKTNLKKMGSVVIGYSAGVDSTFLLKVASDILGEKVLAVTVNSDLFSKQELMDCLKFVKKHGIHHIVIDVDIQDIKHFEENPDNRCYFCKKHIFSKIKEIADQEKFQNIIDASNYDDLKDYRPGMKALEKLGIISPLINAKIVKKEIRLLSKEMGLETWDKPSYACLASRFPYGIKINKKRLKTIEKAEDVLKNFGIRQTRVRFHNDIARLEVFKDDFQKILENADEISKKIKELGFKYVTLDIEGYRSGSLNEVLKK